MSRLRGQIFSLNLSTEEVCACVACKKSILKSNWFFSFLNLIFWNWKKFECHSISQKSSGDRQGVYYIQKATSERVSSHNEVLAIKEKRFVFLCWHQPSFDHKNFFHVNISFNDSSRLRSFLYVVTRSFSKKLFLFHLVVASNFLQESDQQFGRKFLQRTFKVAALPYSIYSRLIWNFNSNIFHQIKKLYKNAVKSDSKLNLLFSVHLLVIDPWLAHQINLRILFSPFFS